MAVPTLFEDGIEGVDAAFPIAFQAFTVFDATAAVAWSCEFRAGLGGGAGLIEEAGGDEMESEACAGGVGAIFGGAMGDAVIEEGDASGGEFDGDDGFFGFIDIAGEVFVAFVVAQVFEDAFMATGDEVEGAVVTMGIMHGDPHADPLVGVWAAEVGVVLVPTGAGAVVAWFQENLIELEMKIIPDQQRDSLADLGGVGEGAEDLAVGAEGAELEVDFFLAMGAVLQPGFDDVAKEAGVAEALDFGLHEAHFVAVEEEWCDGEAVGVVMVDLELGED